MRRQGSITVFFGMVLIVLCSLFFSMVETVRIYEMKLESRVITREALASAFSEYQPYLWDTYGILALDCGYGTCVTDASLLEQRMGDCAWDNCRLGEEAEGKGSQFFQIEPYGCELLSYGCLSDQDGAELVRQGAMVARQQMTEEALTQWGSQYESLVVEEGNLPDVDACVQKAEEAMQNVAEEAETVASGEEMSVEQMSEEQMRLDDANHPLVIFREIKKQGFLGMVIGEHPVSDKTVSMVDQVWNRTRMEGTASNSEEIHAVERLCYDWYLLMIGTIWNALLSGCWVCGNYRIVSRFLRIPRCYNKLTKQHWLSPALRQIPSSYRRYRWQLWQSGLWWKVFLICGRCWMVERSLF